MARTIAQFDTPVVDIDGTQYRAKACGRERDDGLWEGWLEFENLLSGETVRTIRETTQPNLADLTYWATGLTPVYLEGALARAQEGPVPRAPVTVVPPHYDRPAERPRVSRRVKSTGGESILNPFSVYEKSPELLAQELTALRGRHLRQIIRDYGLANASDGNLEAMTEPELGSLIMQRVRELHP